MIVNAREGTQVRFWTGIREGEGRVGRLSYSGIYDICGTQCVYIAGIGAVALSHVEEIFEEKAQ